MSQMDRILEGDQYELLLQWSENEDTQLPEEMADYVQQLEYARGFLYSVSPKQAALRLKKLFDGLSMKQAKSRVKDAIEYFYVDEDLKNDHYRHIHYEIYMRLAELALKSASCVEHLKIVSDLYQKAEKSKQLHLQDKEELPKELYEKKYRIFTGDPVQVGLPKGPSRRELNDLVDKFVITEEQKIKIKQDGGGMPRQILDVNAETENDPDSES